MENTQKIDVPTPEELAQEQIALAETKEDEVRANVIIEYGFDEIDDAERIDKLVAKEIENRKVLSQAIGQKIKERTAKETLLAEKVKIPPQEKANVFDPETLDKKLDERFEKRDLDAMDYSDELKVEIQKIAKMQGISIKKAVQDPYIVFKLSEYEKEQKTDGASISRTNKTGSKTVSSFENPPEPDMSTEEGRAIWAKYKEDMKRQGY